MWLVPGMLGVAGEGVVWGDGVVSRLCVDVQGRSLVGGCQLLMPTMVLAV